MGTSGALQKLYPPKRRLESKHPQLH